MSYQYDISISKELCLNLIFRVKMVRCLLSLYYILIGNRIIYGFPRKQTYT